MSVSVAGTENRRKYSVSAVVVFYADSDAGHVTDGRKLSVSTLYAMQYIIASPVEKLYTFLVKEDVLKELGDVVTAYMAEYLGKSFKSLEILETLIM